MAPAESLDIIPINAHQQSVEPLPTSTLQLPEEGVPLTIDPAVIEAFPHSGTRLLKAVAYAHSIGSSTAKLEVIIPDGTVLKYFVKTFRDPNAQSKCRGEYESLQAIEQVCPELAPKAHAWGKMKDAREEAYFLLEDFIGFQEQPANAASLAASLAELHQRSQSPCDKFGFHLRTWHGEVDQAIDSFDPSWTAVFSRHIRHFMVLCRSKMSSSLELDKFDTLCDLILEKVVPRLLNPLQEQGRNLKPSLVHGDCWDGNTAMDLSDGKARIFDVCSFYGHHEYDVGNWRAPRHRVSGEAYISEYRKHLPPSEPVEDCAARQLLYSLCFNMGNVINIPNSVEGAVVYEDMLTLCTMFSVEQLETSPLGTA